MGSWEAQASPASLLSRNGKQAGCLRSQDHHVLRYGERTGKFILAE
jgi:hypothetical protein